MFSLLLLSIAIVSLLLGPAKSLYAVTLALRVNGVETTLCKRYNVSSPEEIGAAIRDILEAAGKPGVKVKLFVGENTALLQLGHLRLDACRLKQASNAISVGELKAILGAKTVTIASLAKEANIKEALTRLIGRDIEFGRYKHDILSSVNKYTLMASAAASAACNPTTALLAGKILGRAYDHNLTTKHRKQQLPSNMVTLVKAIKTLAEYCKGNELEEILAHILLTGDYEKLIPLADIAEAYQSTQKALETLTRKN